MINYKQKRFEENLPSTYKLGHKQKGLIRKCRIDILKALLSALYCTYMTKILEILGYIWNIYAAVLVLFFTMVWHIKCCLHRNAQSYIHNTDINEYIDRYTQQKIGIHLRLTRMVMNIYELTYTHLYVWAYVNTRRAQQIK